jgi:hypothetical protein
MIATESIDETAKGNDKDECFKMRDLLAFEVGGCGISRQDN